MNKKEKAIASLNLTKRLKKIIEVTPVTKKNIADIGCDHGKVTAALIIENKARSVIAGDKSLLSLNKAISLAKELNISEYISFRNSDGFKDITKYDKVKTAIVAGIGGKETIKILENSYHLKIKRFVFSPHSDIVEFREYLVDHGFKIIYDKMLKEDGRYYNIIVCKLGENYLSDLELYFGKNNLRKPSQDFIEYLYYKKTENEKIKQMVGDFNKKRKKEYDSILEAISLIDPDGDALEDDKDKNKKNNGETK